MAAWVAPAISGVLGLFGKKKSTTTTSSVDYKKMVRDARAAGFNPLTALRNGGTAGFSSQTTSGGELTTPSFIAQALGQGLQAYNDSELRELDVQTERLEQDLMREELRIMQESSRPVAPTRSFGFGIPQSEQTNVQTVSQGPSLASGADGSDTNILYDPDRTSVEVGGVRTNPHMGMSDAELVEQRYGDVSSSLYGLGVIAADAWNTMGGTERTQRLGRRVSDTVDMLFPTPNRSLETGQTRKPLDEDNAFHWSNGRLLPPQQSLSRPTAGQWTFPLF